MTYYGFKHKEKIIKPGTLLKMGDATDPDPNKYIYHIMYINAFVIKKSTPEDPEEACFDTKFEEKEHIKMYVKFYDLEFNIVDAYAIGLALMDLQKVIISPKD